MTDYMVIGRFRNRENIQSLVRAIRAKGKSCYDFAEKDAFPGASHLSPEEQMNELESHPDFLNDPLHKYHFEHDLEGLLSAETIVMLLPGGNSSHVEAGIAFGKGKKLILIGTPDKPETLYYIFNEFYKTPEDFLKMV